MMHVHKQTQISNYAVMSPCTAMDLIGAGHNQWENSKV